MLPLRLKRQMQQALVSFRLLDKWDIIVVNWRLGGRRRWLRLRDGCFQVR